jgi:hypothetical protein
MCRLYCCSADGFPAAVVTSPKAYPPPRTCDRSTTLPDGNDHAPKRS